MREPPLPPLPVAPPRGVRPGAPSSAPYLQADTGTGTEIETESVTSTQPTLPWNVVVWDDPVNLMSYVVYVFQKLFGFSEAIANTKMLEVHNDGRSVVTSAERERAEYFVTRLHAYGLQATLERVAA